MAGTKLEICLSILSILFKHSKLSLNEIVAFLNLDSKRLNNDLRFLLDQGLIQEEKIFSNSSYSVTDHGARVLRFFNIETVS